MKNMTLTATLLALTCVTSASAQKVTLEFWSMWNPNEPAAKVLQQAAADYQAAHPDVKVNFNFAGRDVRKLVIPALTSGKTVDIVENGIDWLTAGATPNYWLPLNKYLTRPLTDDGGKSVSQVLIKPLLDQGRVKGNLVAIPHQPFAVLYLYNKGAFKKAGITKEPTTWAEFTADLKALKGAGYEPITVDEDAYTDVNFGYAALRSLGSCAAVQRAVLDKSGKAWLAPDVLSMAKDIRGLYDAGYYAKNMSGNLYPAGQQRVGLGEVAMNLNGTWLPEEMKATTGPDFAWGSFNYPLQSNGKGSANTVMMGSQAMAVVAKTKYPDQAFDFIHYVVGKKAQEGFVKAANVASSRTDVAWPAALAEARTAILKAKTSVGWACDINSLGEITANVVLPTFKDLLNGKLTPDAYTKKMASDSAKFWATRK